MKLNDVTHYDPFFEQTQSYSVHSNRFVLFDKTGNALNEYVVEDLLNYSMLNVISTCTSSYTSCTYFVGFATTHIKLDIVGTGRLLSGKRLKYGQKEEEGC